MKLRSISFLSAADNNNFLTLLSCLVHVRFLPRCWRHSRNSDGQVGQRCRPLSAGTAAAGQDDVCQQWQGTGTHTHTCAPKLLQRTLEHKDTEWIHVCMNHKLNFLNKKLTLVLTWSKNLSVFPRLTVFHKESDPLASRCDLWIFFRPRQHCQLPVLVSKDRPWWGLSFRIRRFRWVKNSTLSYV